MQIEKLNTEECKAMVCKQSHLNPILGELCIYNNIVEYKGLRIFFEMLEMKMYRKVAGLANLGHRLAGVWSAWKKKSAKKLIYKAFWLFTNPNIYYIMYM